MTTPADGWDRDEREALAPIEAELAETRARHAAEPPLDLLRAARADALPADLQARVAAHLDESAWSRALVDGAGAVQHDLDAASADRLLARITQSTDDKPAWFTRARVWLPVAATAAAIVVVMTVWSSRRAPAPPAAVAGAPVTPAATMARIEPPPFQLPLDKPDVKLSTGALTWRAPSGSTLVNDLAPALDAYRQSDYARAADTLARVERRYPASIEAPFYRGISLLFLNEPADAIAELQKAEKLNDAAFAPDIAWYLAVAEERAGNAAASRTHLEALCHTSTARTLAACEAVKKLDGGR
jgi:hypothetical protein